MGREDERGMREKEREGEEWGRKGERGMREREK